MTLWAEMTDFEFYKKYGHSNKAWNDDVERGFASYDAQKCDEAMASLKQAVASQCQDALVYFKLAVCSEVAGTPYTALQYYQLAEEKLQKLPPALHRYQKDIYENYGRALFQSKRLEEAFPLLTRAAAVGSPSFGLYYMVGYLHAKKGNTAAALEFFEKALSQDISKAPPPILATVYREVAKSYFQNKDYEKSSDLVTKALQINPSDQESLQLKTQIGNIKNQQGIIQMIQNAEDQRTGGTGAPPPPQPLPPAASKLPPLGSTTGQDPTPPLGTVRPPSSNSGTNSRSPGTLEPLPIPPPKK